MAKHYVLTEELKRDVQQVCKQFLSSFQPRPRKGRRRRSGGSGGGTSNIRFARVTTAFDAASGPLAADWKDGVVKYQSDTTGEVSTTGTDCKNSLIGIAFGIDYQVEVDTGYSPPRIVNGTCSAVDWGD